MSKILIDSPNLIGKSMAGPAIRAWEFAKALANHHRVILISPGPPEIQAEGFDCLSFQNPACKQQFQDADVLIAQRLTVPLASLASSHQVKVIIDAYCPSPLELLEYHKKESPEGRHKKIASEISTLSFSFKMADGILCASEKQRELWLGFLMAQKLITPSLYDRDPSLRNFLDVVPFGLSSTPPRKNGKGLKEKLGLRPEDKVLLWGGGIWNWFDPLSLIRAMKSVSLKRPDIKLVFMGVKAPDPAITVMSMAQEAMRLADDLGLIGRSVFFHQEWIPYEERENFLLDADIGVSTHFDHLETRFSFRTRILDYLWAELPIIATEGDSFAELIGRHHLGDVVPYQNEASIAESILKLLSDQEELLRIKRNIGVIREQFYWNRVVIPLQQMIERLTLDPRPRKGWQERKALMSFLISKIREKGVAACLQKALFNRSR